MKEEWIECIDELPEKSGLYEVTLINLDESKKLSYDVLKYESQYSKWYNIDINNQSVVAWKKYANIHDQYVPKGYTQNRMNSKHHYFNTIKLIMNATSDKLSKTDNEYKIYITEDHFNYLKMTLKTPRTNTLNRYNELIYDFLSYWTLITKVTYELNVEMSDDNKLKHFIKLIK